MSGARGLARWCFHRGRLFHRVWRWLDLPTANKNGDRYWFSNLRHYWRCNPVTHWLIGRWFEGKP